MPLYEDTAALVGVVIAAAGLLGTQISGSVVPDAVASFGVGAVLVFVTWRLAVDSRALPLGEAVPPEHERCPREAITSFEEVADILRLYTMQLGPDAALVNAEIQLADGLEPVEIDELRERITEAMRDEVREVTQTFLELHPPGRADQPSSPRNGRTEL